ncbi:MAG: hypothetical protein AMS21_07455 [Gemmatimonas sp. SG8_38_2]|nr:MAG: hypothetical protein AMS21_07455 [Gemmatimonas sp. SG8_38_2]
MGGVRAVRAARCAFETVLVMTIAYFTLSCGRASEGQQANLTDAELERMVEELLPRIEELSGLAVKRVPAVRRASSETLETYLLERLEAEYPDATLENLAAAYRAFGLISDTLDVRDLLVDLLLEQAIGYYDPVRDVLFIRDEASGTMVDAVIVHELVHALQDQQSDLDSLTHSVTSNDARTAIQSAMEGHATAVMLAYQYSEMTGSRLAPEDLPELGPEMGAAMADPSAFPELAGAPAIVREPLLFAYLGGARYIQRLWRSEPDRPAPFGVWLPESTEQLIHTERLLVERDSPTPMRVGDATGDWREMYAWDLGELEMRIYFEEHLGDSQLAARAAAGWDGDAYSLLVRDGDVALVWYTAWDSDADADEFSDAYRRAFAARHGGGGAGELLLGSERQARVERLDLSGIPIMRVVESAAGIEVAEPPEIVLEPQVR